MSFNFLLPTLTFVNIAPQVNAQELKLWWPVAANIIVRLASFEETARQRWTMQSLPASDPSADCTHITCDAAHTSCTGAVTETMKYTWASSRLLCFKHVHAKSLTCQRTRQPISRNDTSRPERVLCLQLPDLSWDWLGQQQASMDEARAPQARNCRQRIWQHQLGDAHACVGRVLAALPALFRVARRVLREECTSSGLPEYPGLLTSG